MWKVRLTQKDYAAAILRLNLGQVFVWTGHSQCKGALWMKVQDKYPNAYVKCSGQKDLRLEFYLFPAPGNPGIGITIPRDLARLLAKRINQCLMDTQ